MKLGSEDQRNLVTHQRRELTQNAAFISLLCLAVCTGGASMTSTSPYVRVVRVMSPSP